MWDQKPMDDDVKKNAAGDGDFSPSLPRTP
jgi:hypothetical protein